MKTESRLRWKVTVYNDGNIGVLLQCPHWRDAGVWSSMWGGSYTGWPEIVRLFQRIPDQVVVTWLDGPQDWLLVK